MNGSCEWCGKLITDVEKVMDAPTFSMATGEGWERIHLHFDRDDRWRWYDADGNDLEVSGRSQGDAIDQAWSAWKNWGLKP